MLTWDHARGSFDFYWFYKLDNIVILSGKGYFLQSAYSEQKVNALAASFVHTPAGENVDWRLSATISPCHVTVIYFTFPDPVT